MPIDFQPDTLDFQPDESYETQLAESGLTPAEARSMQDEADAVADGRAGDFATAKSLPSAFRRSNALQAITSGAEAQVEALRHPVSTTFTGLAGAGELAGVLPEGETGRIKEASQKSLLQFVPDFGPPEGQIYGQPDTSAKIAYGALNAVKRVAEFLTTPDGMLLLSAGGGAAASPNGARVLSGAFAVDMARGAPEQFNRALEAIEKGDTKAASEAVTSFLIGAGGSAIAARHALTRPGGAVISARPGELMPEESRTSDQQIPPKPGAEAPLAQIDYEAARIGPENYQGEMPRYSDKFDFQPEPAPEKLVPGNAIEQPATGATGQKMPWEMTKKEYADSLTNDFIQKQKDAMAADPDGRYGTDHAKSKKFIKQLKERLSPDYIGSAEARQHRDLISKAIEEGKPVPESVLADYPDLKPATPAATGATKHVTNQSVEASKLVEASRQAKLKRQDDATARLATLSDSDLAKMDKFELNDLEADLTLGMGHPYPNKSVLLKQLSELRKPTPAATGATGQAKGKPMNMAGQVRPERPKPTPAPEFTAIHPKSQEKFNAAWESRSIEGMQALLHPENRGMRAEWEKRTAAKLPKGVRDTDKAIADFFSKPTPPAAVVTPAPPSERIGIIPASGGIPDWHGLIPRAIQSVRTTLQTWAGKSAPRTTDLSREAGEKLVHWASARIDAPFRGRAFTMEALRGLDVDPISFGALLTEGNLRGIKAQRIAEGKVDEAAQVKSLVGGPGSPFRTEQALQDYANRPGVKEALKRHVELWNQHVDPEYRLAMGFDNELQLPARGEFGGARINLYVPDRNSPSGRTAGAGLLSTLRRKSPFGVRATGASERYGIDYREIMANTFGRQSEIARKRDFEDTLVASGHARIGAPGLDVQFDGKPAASFPLKRTMLIERNENGVISQVPVSQYLYLPKNLKGEYLRAANILGGVKGLLEDATLVRRTFQTQNALTLVTLREPAYHLRNLGRVLFSRPQVGLHNPIADIMLSAMGRVDIPITAARWIKRGAGERITSFLGDPQSVAATAIKESLPKFLVDSIEESFLKNQKQIAELARIGAWRGEYTPETGIGRVLHKVNILSHIVHAADKGMRLVMSDAFDSLARRGVVEATETNKREFVNHGLQYNKRLQGALTRALRESNIDPFITARKASNALSIRNLLLDPGVRAATGLDALTLRASVLAKWIGSAVLILTANYVLTRNKGGGALGRPGTPMGRIDTGDNDKNGRPIHIPAFDMMGFGRSFLTTGIRGYTESKRLGLGSAEAMDAAARDAVNSWLYPVVGPAIRNIFLGISGRDLSYGVPRVSPVVPPGQSQSASDLANAVYKSVPPIDIMRSSGRLGKYAPGFPYVNQLPPRPASEILGEQLAGLGGVPGKRESTISQFPRIVEAAHVNEYLDDVIHRSRQMSTEQRRTYLREAIKNLPARDREHALREFERRRVFAPVR